MNLVQFQLRPDTLLRFAQAQGLNTFHDGDLGYTVHALLQALFNDLAPKPFRILSRSPADQLLQSDERIIHPRSQHIRVLAYSPHSATALGEHVDTFALPGIHEILIRESLASKAMPEQWQVGRQLGFELLVCPVSRQEKIEKDIFLRFLERGDVSEPANRYAIYQQWLHNHFRDTARLLKVQLSAFRLISLLRRNHTKAAKRSNSILKRPQALFNGVLEIRDSEAFNKLLARGVGRHRAFGYGMLLLRPNP